MRALDMQFTPFFALGCSGIRGCLEVRRFRMIMPGLNKEQRTQPQRCRDARKPKAWSSCPWVGYHGVFHGGILLYSQNVGVPRAVVFMILLNSSSSTLPLINSFLGHF